MPVPFAAEGTGARSKLEAEDGPTAICARCGRVRGEGGQWRMAPQRCGGRARPDVPHRICPACLARIRSRRRARRHARRPPSA